MTKSPKSEPPKRESTRQSAPMQWDPGMDGYSADNAPSMEEESPFANDFPEMGNGATASWEEKATGKKQSAQVVEEDAKVAVKESKQELPDRKEKAKGNLSTVAGERSKRNSEDDSAVAIKESRQEFGDRKESADEADAPPTPHAPQPAHRHAPTAHRGRRMLRIVFSRSGQLDRDKWRLREIVEAVRDPKGRDQFVIITETDGRRHQLSFPNDYCTVTERLLGELQKYFNVDVSVEE